MKSETTRAFGFLCVFLLTVCGICYADWPQYMGPDRNGISPDKGLMRAWPEGGPRVLWTVPVGPGYAGPAIYKGEVFLLDRVDDQKDVLRCFALDTGEERWNVSYDAPGKVGHTGSRTTPTVDDRHIYSVGMTGRFLCTDRVTHAVVWQKDLLADFGAERPNWGVAQAPVLYRNLVIVAPQARDAFAAAFDRDTGRVVWKSPGLGLPGYVSPLVTTLAGVDQLVVIGASNKSGTQKGAVAGLSLEDGSILWKYEGWDCFIPIPFPTPLPGDRLFVTGGYNAGSVMLQVRKGAAGLEVTELFRLDPKTCGSQIHQPIFYRDHLYLNSNSNENQGGMTCLTLDGTVKWRTADTEGLPLFERGSLILADDLIIALGGKTGILHLIEPSPEGYKELARAQAVEGRELWGPLAISDGKLLVRSQEVLKCLDLRGS